jgi:dTDP-glucose pyrophosphorylase/CBS domain-containing protein
VDNWRNILLRGDDPIRRALEVIDAGQMRIALIIDADGRLVGTVTDGDIRRGLLRGLNLADPVAQAMNPHPLTGSPSMSRAQMLEFMRRHGVSHLPTVDAGGRLLSLETDIELYDAGERPNWIVLMAGGLGQRLRPLTEELPKPLLPVGDRPLLEIILDRFLVQGFRKFFISVNYRAELVEAHFGDGGRFGAEIRYLREEAPLGTAGAIGLLPKRPEHPFVIMNGDLLTTVHFDKLIEFHQQHDTDLTLCVRRYSLQIPYGVAEIQGNQVVSIVEKPNHECFISGGIYVANPTVFDRLNPLRRIDMPDLMRELIADRQRVTAFPVTDYWIDIGRVEDLERARAEIDSGQ